MKKLLPYIVTASLLSGCADLFENNKTITKAKLASFNPSVKVEPIWQAAIGKGTESEYFRLHPVVDHGTVYGASHDGAVMALNTITSDTIWRTEIKPKISSGIAVGDDVVVVGTPDGELIAFNKAHGTVHWKAQVGGNILTPVTIANGKVFAKLDNGKICALDSASGKILWHYNEPTPDMMLRANSSPSVVGENVIVGFADGQVVALNVDTGKPQWKLQVAEPIGTSVIERMVDVASSPQSDGEKVYVVSYHGELKAIDAVSGKTYWHHKLSSFAGMTLNDKTLYISDNDSHVWAFDTATGKVKWRQEKLFGRGLTSPTIVGKYLVLGDDEGYVHWLSQQDGHFVARQRATMSPILTAPISDGKRAFVYSANGALVQFKILS